MQRGVQFQTNAPATIDSSYVRNNAVGIRIDTDNTKVRYSYVYNNTGPTLLKSLSPEAEEPINISVASDALNTELIEINFNDPDSAIASSYQPLSSQQVGEIAVEVALTQTEDVELWDPVFLPFDQARIDSIKAALGDPNDLNLASIIDGKDHPDGRGNVILKYSDYTPPTGIKEKAPRFHTNYTAFPNPTNNGLFNLSYNLPKAWDVEHSIYNAKGQRIARKHFIGLKGGNEVQLKLDVLVGESPSGVYFIQSYAITPRGRKKIGSTKEVYIK